MKTIKETKYNKWFREIFLPSFGECKGKQITEKQARIFEKYLKEEEDNWKHSNAFYYSGIICGKKVRLQESRCYNGTGYNSNGRVALYREIFFVTIKTDNTDKINALRAEIKSLDKKYDELLDNNASDAELDMIDNAIDELYKTIDNLY